MTTVAIPRHLRDIQENVLDKLTLIKKPNSDLYETRQIYLDLVLEIYQEGFKNLIDSTITYSSFLKDVKKAYEKAIQIRDERISQFITQDLKDENFSEYLAVMRERDARFSLYFENLGLQLKIRELDGSSYPVDRAHGDPAVLRIALDRCREQLSSAQAQLQKMREEYDGVVPRREYDALEARHDKTCEELAAVRNSARTLQDSLNKTRVAKQSTEEELLECKERCSELERAGTPRPHWELCADFISGGRDRWWQLASGLSSREILRVLLKELGPAAESDHLEYFDGLGTGPAVPAYLRWSGRVRNLRLSRRELCVLVCDIWRSKDQLRQLPMHEHLTRYFEERYHQPSMRAEWAYNLCAGAEQALDEPQLQLFLRALHGAERGYWALREQWAALRTWLQTHHAHQEAVSVEELERACRAVFPLKSEVELRSLSDAARRQLKPRAAAPHLNLDKLFHESEEGFLSSEMARELARQRAAGAARYLRELLAELGGRRAGAAPVSSEAFKRAVAIVDPAIDHIRMEQYIRAAFSVPSGPLAAVPAAPLRTLASRLAAADFERIGPRHRGQRRSYK